MKIGYACLAIGVPDTQQKTCRKINATQEYIGDLIRNNLCALRNTISYNIKNDILLFRISSDLIPFGSSPVNTLPWSDIFKEELKEIGDMIKRSGMRVSMHPGQYTVLNSTDTSVIERAVDDLYYHALVLDSLHVDETHKIILHIGGVYQDREVAIQRFIQSYLHLDERIKRRLVIENDDRSYGIQDVLSIGEQLRIPVVFDNLHNAVLPSNDVHTEKDWVDACKGTWKKSDGMQKIHYSQQHPQKKAGSHSDSIQITPFMNFLHTLDRDDIDIMLEVKDKNLSAVKCINCTSPDRKVKNLEVEWSKYKYAVLERSQEEYLKIRTMLAGRSQCKPVDFYMAVEDALAQGITAGNAINAAQPIWGYFKKDASEKEKAQFLMLLKRIEEDIIYVPSIKKFLWKLVLKYEEKYLMQAYYFFL